MGFLLISIGVYFIWRQKTNKIQILNELKNEEKNKPNVQVMSQNPFETLWVPDSTFDELALEEKQSSHTRKQNNFRLEQVKEKENIPNNKSRLAIKAVFETTT